VACGLYEIADGKRNPGPEDPEVFCLEEFGPLNLQPQPPVSGPAGADAVSGLVAAYDLRPDRVGEYVEANNIELALSDAAPARALE